MAERSLSIVIPAWNEARRLGRSLARIRDYAARVEGRVELVVVDDGSQDGTADVVRGFEPGPLTVRLLVNPTNRGKGYSVRQGMLAATGTAALMCDADLSTPIEEIEKLWAWLDGGHDIVIGSRDLAGAQLDPPQPRARRMVAWGLRVLRQRLLVPYLHDTQCGFKLFRRDAAREVFARQKVNGWLFDCEVLGIADRLGYRIKEVGVLWQNDPDSRVNMLREAFCALPTLLAIRRRLAWVERR